MKQNNFLKIAFLFLFLFVFIFNSKAQSAGDIAFVGFNTDGDKDFAIVALADIAANSTIYFTDDSTTGVGSPSALTGGEGTITWSSGSNIINAGTIVIFSDLDNDSNPNFGVNIGSITRSGSFNISSSRDNIIAYIGTLGTPTTYIAAIQIGTASSGSYVIGPFDGDGITLTNTTLVIGTSLILADNSASPDGGVYNGSRSGQVSFSGYYSDIEDNSNWSTSTTDGESFLPFSQEAFTTNTTNWSGGTSSVWNLAGNWDNGIPTSSSLANIPEVGTAPIISSTATVGNLNITEADGLTISSGGSLIVGGTSTGNVTYNRTLTIDADNAKSWHLVSSPVSGEIMTDIRANNNLLTNGSSLVSFATYDNTTDANGDWVYFGNTATDALTNGRGYSAKVSSGDLSFTGTINTSNVSIALTQGSGGSGNNFNLLGNPYTSSINSGDFITQNTSELTQAEIYVWEEASEQYLTKLSSANFKVSPAQGFFVEASSTNSVVFSKGIQSHETDNFQKSVNTRPEVKLNVTDGSLNRFADIYYINGTTTGFDNGYDGKLFGGVSHSFAVFSNLVDNSNTEKYQIQSLPDSNYENMVVPIGGKEIVFTAEALNLPSGIKVFLEDRELSKFTRLDEVNSSYKITLGSALSGSGRFFLHTRSSALSTDDIALSGINIFATNKNTLRVTGVNDTNTSIKIYNILGKKILDTSFASKGVADVNLPNFTSGVYIVQLTTEKGKLSKKIVLE